MALDSSWHKMETKLSFLDESSLPDKEKPFVFLKFPNIPADRQSNYKHGYEHNVLLTDVRGHEKDFDLFERGFAFKKHRSNCQLDLSRFEVRGKDDLAVDSYLQESISVLKEALGVSQVICFDWRIRKKSVESGLDPLEDMERIRSYTIPPSENIHCDFSRIGGWKTLEMYLSDREMAKVKSGAWRARFVNVWRPFKAVENAPLVLCDRQSVSQDDLVEVDRVYPDAVEYTYYLKHRNHHKWYWLSDQRPDEVTLLLTWDSLSDTHNLADTPPHGAALGIGKERMPRESIEWEGSSREVSKRINSALGNAVYIL